MTILRDISFLWSMLHIIALFLLLFEPRYSWRTTFLAGFAGAGTLLTVNVLTMLWLGHGIIMSAAFFTCTIPTMLLFLWLSKYRDGRFFFLFCLSDTMCFWILQITNLLDRLTGDTYVVMLIGRLLAFPAAEWLLWRYLRRPYLELQRNMKKGWWLFAGIGGTYYLLIMVTAIPVDSPMPDTAGIIRLFLVMLLMPLTYLTILRTLWQQMQIYENRWQMELQSREYNSIRQKMELSRVYRHDIRHHLVVLEGLLQQEDSRGALQYIQELSGKLSSLVPRTLCANTAVNAVLSAYTAQAEDAGIRVEMSIHLPAELPYGEMDVCIILANALENAIHACRDLPEADIRLEASLTDNRRIRLSVDNACPHPVEFGDGGLPVVLSRGEHGLGLRSVSGIVQKYGGLFQVKWENGRFYLQTALFPPSVSRT